jgi:hypothetical protein
MNTRPPSSTARPSAGSSRQGRTILDVLRDEGEAFARKLDRAGIDVISTRDKGLIHDDGLVNTVEAHPPWLRGCPDPCGCTGALQKFSQQIIPAQRLMSRDGPPYPHAAGTQWSA